MASLGDSDLFLLNGSVTWLTSTLPTNAKRILDSSKGIYRYDFPDPGWDVTGQQFGPVWPRVAFESEANGTPINGGGTGYLNGIIFVSGSTDLVSHCNVVPDDPSKWPAGNYITSQSIDESKSFCVQAKNLFHTKFSDCLVLLHHQDTKVSSTCRVANLRGLDNSDDELYMLANKGAVSYRVKLSRVLEKYGQISAVFSDYVKVINLANNQPLVPPPTATNGRTPADSFDGNQNTGYYLYRPTHNGSTITNVQWTYECAALNMYCRTLRIKCGWQGVNGRGDIYVNGSRLVTNMDGKDFEGSWSPVITVNDTLREIKLVQTGSGSDSFGVYAVDVNGVRLIDGGQVPTRQVMEPPEGKVALRRARYVRPFGKVGHDVFHNVTEPKELEELSDLVEEDGDVS